MHVSQKPTLADVRNQHYFDIAALAEQAGMDPSVIRRMLSCQPVRRYQAELVLAAFADEFGAGYTLETVEIVLFPEEEKEEHET